LTTNLHISFAQQQKTFRISTLEPGIMT